MGDCDTVLGVCHVLHGDTRLLLRTQAQFRPRQRAATTDINCQVLAAPKDDRRHERRHEPATETT